MEKENGEYGLKYEWHGHEFTTDAINVTDVIDANELVEYDDE